MAKGRDDFGMFYPLLNFPDLDHGASVYPDDPLY